MAWLVLAIYSMELSTTTGNSRVFEILWPLAWTKGTNPEAAIAEATACLFYFWFTLLCHLLHIFTGANILPFRHMLPKAAFNILRIFFYLTAPVGSWSGNSWNSGHGSTGSPGFSGVFVTCSFVNSVSLSSVFVKVGVDKAYDIESIKIWDLFNFCRIVDFWDKFTW